MNKSVKISAVAGSILYGLAVFFALCLLAVAFDFAGENPAEGLFVYRIGKTFTGVYGFCSILIPLFLLTAAFECFTSKWRVRNGVMLLGSIIPFFTLDAVEHICHMMAENNSGDILAVKIFAALLTGGLIVAVEYLVLSMIGDAVEGKKDEEEETSVVIKETEKGSKAAAEVSEKKVSETVEAENPFAEIEERTNALAEKSAEDIDYEKAVEKDSLLFKQHKNDLKVLREKMAEHRRQIAEMQEAGETDKTENGALEPNSVNESAVENEKPEIEMAGEDNPFAHIFDEEKTEAEVQETAVVENEADEESDVNEISVSDAAEEVDVDEIAVSDASEEVDENSDKADDSAADETAAESAENFDTTYSDFEEKAPLPLTGEENVPDEDDSFDDITLDLPSENEISFDQSVYEEETADTVEAGEEESNYVEEDCHIPGESPVETSPFDDFDFPSEMEEETENGSSSLNSAGESDFDDFEIPDLGDEKIIEGLGQDDEAVIAEPVYEAEKVKKETLDEIAGADDDVIFGDVSFSSEYDNDEGENDLNSFVEKRNNNISSIFAQMDNDAAENPVESKTEAFDDDFDNLFNESELEKGVAKELEEDPTVHDEWEFDPMADPVVDSNGMPFGPAVPFEIEDSTFEEVTKAKKTSKPLSFAEKAVFLQDSEEAVAEEKKAPAKTEAQPEKPVSSKMAVDSNGKPVVDMEKIEKKKPKLRLSNYKIPVEGILQTYENGEYWVIDEDTKRKAQDLKQTLGEFNIDVEITGIRKGPVVTMFEVLPAPGVNVNKIRSLQDNIALRLAATSVRIVSPIPGKRAVGIEIPNTSRAIVSFREIMEKKNPAFEKMNIPVILGKDISGEPQIIDLAKTPHLLIAGSTGAGKSVCVNSLILSILYKRNPQQVKLILVDPKVVELKLYNDIPHLLTPVITEPKKALQSLQYCLCEMERRYALLDNMGVRDISSYNRRIEERQLMQEKLPYIVVIIDEFADLMATTGKELESNVARLAAMSRAVGIHLVLATQRPSVNVITGLIKANIPSRIAFMVASRTDSNIIIDQIGAEKLLGKGDMLYASATNPFPVRIQGTLVSDDEVEKVVEYVKQYGEPDYIDDEIFVEDEDEGDGNPGLFSDGEDALYDQALQIVVQSGKASASYLQRRLKIGYNRAARLVEEMEERGIVGPQNGSKPREVIYVP